MDFTCYLLGDWDPQIRPAPPTRDWMDATRGAFAYRCLPLNIANAHGWEILTPAGFSVYWRGGSGADDVIIRPDRDMPPLAIPRGNFGMGIVSIPILALFRTPPGWNLMVGGSPNWAKDGIAPISGIVEADWCAYTFLANWRITRRNHWVRFEAGEPICFVMPVLRGALERMEPKVAPLTSNHDLLRQHMEWRQAREEFVTQLAETRSTTPSDRWTKRYYTGQDMDGNRHPDHRAKLRLKPFVPGVPDDTAEATVTVDTERLRQAMLNAGLSADAADAVIRDSI